MQIREKIENIIDGDKSKIIGFGFIAFGLIILILIYLPILISYSTFALQGDPDTDQIEEIQKVSIKNEKDESDENIDIPKDVSELFPDREYSLLIPEIGAEAKIIQDVDPFNEYEYSRALKDGVAHASTTNNPGEGGNTFLFAHSALNFYDLLSENVNFYLLSQLEDGDSVFTMYRGEIYEYEVVDNKIVDPSEIEYLHFKGEKESVTLMTCWPAGTDYKRVIVVAERK